MGSILDIDGKTSYPVLEPTYQIKTQVNDYKNKPEHLKWLNIAVSNLKSFLAGTYHGIAKKYLKGYINEFAWRYNRRKLGVNTLDAGMRTVMSALVMSYQSLVALFQA